MINCSYDTKTIEDRYPMECCFSCDNNKEDDDGTYYCKTTLMRGLKIDNVHFDEFSFKK